MKTIKYLFGDSNLTIRGSKLAKSMPFEYDILEKKHDQYYIEATIKGIHDTYTTTLKFRWPEDKLPELLDYSCTCPCDYECKHVIALFLNLVKSDLELTNKLIDSEIMLSELDEK